MKKNLKDYRTEMERMQVKSDSSQGGVPVEVNKSSFQKKESLPNILRSKKWVTLLLPGLMVILIAVFFLIFLIIAEVIKKR